MYTYSCSMNTYAFILDKKKDKDKKDKKSDKSKKKKKKCCEKWKKGNRCSNCPLG
jgi:hypothetical protein